MGTFHACGNTWRYDLKNINQRKSQMFLNEGKNIVICALWCVQSTLLYATTLDARQSGRLRWEAVIYEKK